MIESRGWNAQLPERLERRGAPRITEPFPALIRRVDCAGYYLEEEVVLDNLSAYGLHTHLEHKLYPGDTLLVIVRFTLGAEPRSPGPGVAAKAMVVRSIRQNDGRYAVALVFLQHRLLFATQT